VYNIKKTTGIPVVQYIEAHAEACHGLELFADFLKMIINRGTPHWQAMRNFNSFK
jgi:hypothetical protein